MENSAFGVDELLDNSFSRRRDMEQDSANEYLSDTITFNDRVP